jgi:hypothetical protein
MLLLNHPPLGAASPAHLKTLAALQAVAGKRSAFFTAGAQGGDAEREDLWLGTRLFGLSVSKRAYLYMLRGHLGAQAPGVMPAEQRAKQLMLAAELFAGARNAYAKAELHEQELVAYFLCMRCALRSGAPMQGYMQDMASHYAEWVGQRAETLAQQRLQQHDLPGFLAMTTVAASAYQDNTGALGPAERKQRDTFTIRHLTHLHEYLKAHQARLVRTDVAMVQRVMGLWAALDTTATPLPEWLQEVLGHAPGRAATGFLQEAAEQDKQRNKSAAAWWWAHAAEALADTSRPEAWQRPFIESAPQEAAKRLGELATAAKTAEVDVHDRALLAAACHRQTRAMPWLPVAWLESFQSRALVDLADELRQELSAADTASPSLGRALEGALLAGLGGGLVGAEGLSEDRRAKDITLGLKQIVEAGGGSLPTITV